jgi:hypothetical protein
VNEIGVDNLILLECDTGKWFGQIEYTNIVALREKIREQSSLDLPLPSRITKYNLALRADSTKCS